MANPKRALVTFPDGVWKLIRNDLKGKVGDSDSEVIRNIVLSFLTEKGYFEAAKIQPTIQDESSKETMSQFAERLRLLEAMVEAFAELLQEQDIITSLGWKERIDKILQAENNVK